MGDHQQRDQFLRQAQQTTPEAKIAVELTQAELQISNQQWEQALATLRHLKDLAPNHPYVLKLLAELYQQVRDWKQLIELLPVLKKHQVFEEKKFEAFKEMVFCRALSELVKSNHQHAIDEFIANMPKDLAYQTDINTIYIDYLIQQQRDAEAESRLRRLIKKNPSEKFIERYSQCHGNCQEQLAFAESLQKKISRSPALLLCLGRLSCQNKLWGKAEHYLEQALELNPTPAVYAELGKLYEKLDESDKAKEMFKLGLLSANGQPHKDEG